MCDDPSVALRSNLNCFGYQRLRIVMPALQGFLSGALAFGLASGRECRAEDRDTSGASNPAARATGLSLEELMNVRATTVSRAESTVGESPAAVLVITHV